jgi:hypothetical protein
MNTWKAIALISATSLLLAPYLLNDEELWLTLIAGPIVPIGTLVYLYSTFLIIAIDDLKGKIFSVAVFIVYVGFVMVLLVSQAWYVTVVGMLFLILCIALMYLLMLIVQLGNTKGWWIHIIHPSLPPRMKGGVILFGLVVSCLLVALTFVLQNSPTPYKELSIILNHYWFITYPMPLVASILIYLAYNISKQE